MKTKLEMTEREAESVLLVLDNEVREAVGMDAHGKRHITRIYKVTQRLNELLGGRYVLNVPGHLKKQKFKPDPKKKSIW